MNLFDNINLFKRKQLANKNMFINDGINNSNYLATSMILNDNEMYLNANRLVLYFVYYY